MHITLLGIRKFKQLDAIALDIWNLQVHVRIDESRKHVCVKPRTYLQGYVSA